MLRGMSSEFKGLMCKYIINSLPLVLSGLIWFHTVSKYWPGREKTCLQGLANNNGTDQPAHPRSLISAFVIGLFERIISTLATCKIQFSSYSL